MGEFAVIYTEDSLKYVEGAYYFLKRSAQEFLKRLRLKMCGWIRPCCDIPYFQFGYIWRNTQVKLKSLFD